MSMGSMGGMNGSMPGMGGMNGSMPGMGGMNGSMTDTGGMNMTTRSPHDSAVPTPIPCNDDEVCKLLDSWNEICACPAGQWRALDLQGIRYTTSHHGFHRNYGNPPCAERHMIGTYTSNY